MEPESSLPCVQRPATCPYLEPDQPSQCTTSQFLKIHLNIILPSTPGFPKRSLFLKFPQQNPVCTSTLPPYVLHVPPISFFLILSPEQYWVSSTDHKVPHSVVSSTPPVTSSLLAPNIPLNTLFSNTLNLRSSLNVIVQVSHPYKTIGKIIVLYILFFKGTLLVAQLVEALRYKLEGRGFGSRCCHWNFSFT